MENFNRTSTMKAAAISVFVTVIFFVIVIIGAQIMLPAYLFDSSDYYYIIAVLLELIPLGFGVALYLFLTGQKISDVFVFSKPQAKMNKKYMPLLIFFGALMAFVGRYLIVGVQLIWLELLDVVGYNVVEIEFPPINSTTVFIWAILGVAVTPAIFEELIFRGILQKGLLRNAKPRNAIIISSVLFMLMHMSVESLSFTFVWGLVLGYMAYKSGSIWPSVAFHFVNNAFSVVALYVMELFNLTELQESADLAQFGMEENIAMGVMFVISLALFSLVLWGFNRVSKSPPDNPNIKPMKPVSIVLIVLSGCILFLVMTFFAILQNIMPM